MIKGRDLRFDIWKEGKDYIDWYKYIEYFRREPSFGKEKSEDLENIYLFLKKELGKEFLAKPYKDGRDIINSWLWSRGTRYSELKWLKECLVFFRESDCNYQRLIGKLRSAEKCNTEGIPFLIIGDSLRKAGFEIIFEPKTNFRTNPDLKIINPNTGELIFGEVSQQNESDETKYIRATYHFFLDYFHHTAPFVSFTGKIHQHATKQELLKVGEKILQLKEKAHQQESLIIVHKKETGGIIEFAVAHEKKLKDLQGLKMTKRYQVNNVEGQNLNLDYSERVKSKVKDKIVQHPECKPLVIYIPLNQIFFTLGLRNIYSLINEIEEILSKFTHVLGVCMFVYFGEKTESFKEVFNGNFRECKAVFDNYMQLTTVFVKNKEFKLEAELSEDSVNRLYNSFERTCE